MITKDEMIAQINAVFNKIKNEVDERCAYRQKNYIDCIDDYSEFGPCYKADMMLLDSARRHRDIRIEEVNNGGTHRETTIKYVLLNSDGEIVANTIVNGKFGPCWITKNNVFVGVPKKISTLNKKGYTLAMIETAYDCVLNNVTVNGKVHNSSMKKVCSKNTVLNNMPEYIPTGAPYADYQYDTYFAA